MRIRRNRNSALRWLERLLLGSGLALLAFWAGSKLTTWGWQKWENHEFNRELQTQSSPDAGTDQAGAGVPIQPAKPGPLARTRPAPLPPPAHGSLLGRLTIPRLGLNAMVREGDDATTLGLALGHIPGTGLPGDAGNVAIAGHRDSFFRPLRNIQKGDVVRLQTLHGSHEYRVDSTRIVKPNDVSVLNPGPVPELTLVTCYPFYFVGHAPKRFIVSAHEVGGEQAAGGQQVQAEVQPPAVPTQPVDQKIVLSAQVLPGDDDPPAATDKADKGTSEKPEHRLHRSDPSGPATASFHAFAGKLREVAPGISVEFTNIDRNSQRARGWIRLKAERRSIPFHLRASGDPLVFYQHGDLRELLLTGVSANSVTASLLVE